MVTKLQSRAVGFDRRESRASITCPRGLASFVTNHFIDDLVPTRLFSISGLAADIRGDPEGFAVRTTMAGRLCTLLALMHWDCLSACPRNPTKMPRDERLRRC
jgi:hypothetical protein